MVNGMSYPFTIDGLEELFLDSNFSQPYAILLSACDEVPDDLLDAYYTPFNLLETAIIAILGVAVGIVMYKAGVKLIDTKCPDFLPTWLKEHGEAQLDCEEESPKTKEALTVFFWILQLILGASFAVEYFWSKSPYGTAKTGWHACKMAHISLLYLYKPFVPPMFVCLLNLEYYATCFFFGTETILEENQSKLVRPTVIKLLTYIALSLLALWSILTLPYYPVALVSPMLWVLCLFQFIASLPAAFLLIALSGIKEEDGVLKEAKTKMKAAGTRLAACIFLTWLGYFPLLALIFYKDPSSWGRLQTLVWFSGGKLFMDSIDFSWLKWPNLSFDVEFKLSVALSVLAAEKLMVLWAHYYVPRKQIQKGAA